jgi:hypothetical protein
MIFTMVRAAVVLMRVCREAAGVLDPINEQVLV